MATSANKIVPELASRLDKGEKVNAMIAFEDTAPVLATINLPENSSRGDRATAVNKALEEHRERCQVGVEKLLKERNVKYTTFWISNQISVQGVDKELLLVVAEDPQVIIIRPEVTAHLMGGVATSGAV